MNTSIETIPSPVGPLTCVVRGDTLAILEMEENVDRVRACLSRMRIDPADLDRAATPSDVARRIGAYFEGDLGALDAIDVVAHGTPFEQRVYAELRKIPCGEVISYTELARRAGRPEAVRAAGATNAKNPIAIVVPCHRVIGADGSLTGYAGGLERKRWLLAHEGALGAGRATGSPLVGEGARIAGGASMDVSASASEAGSRPDRSPRGGERSRAAGGARCSA